MLRMKNIFLYILLLISFQASTQATVITLADCLDKAMANRANIQSANTELMLANLQRLQAESRYQPQLSAAYELRYNPIIPSQIVPVGQFGPQPTDETRAIQFGTPWQQNAGLSFSKPLIDLGLRNRIAESKINETLRQADLQLVKDELTHEVLKSFGRLLSLENQYAGVLIDTLRTWRTLDMMRSRYDEGRLLKTDLNKASLNHNQALLNLRSSMAELVKEKIFLSFLTTYELEVLLEATFDYRALTEAIDGYADAQADPSAIAQYQQLAARESLLQQQLQTEAASYLPSLSAQAFLGANQFSNQFNPFAANSWFGNSYVGLAVKWPLLLGESKTYRRSQLHTQLAIVGHDRRQLDNQLQKDQLLAEADIRFQREQLEITAANVQLLEENVALYQARFAQGQLNAYDLNNQELDLQQEKNKLVRQEAALVQKQIERLYVSGNVRRFSENR